MTFPPTPLWEGPCSFFSTYSNLNHTPRLSSKLTSRRPVCTHVHMCVCVCVCVCVCSAVLSAPRIGRAENGRNTGLRVRDKFQPCHLWLLGKLVSSCFRSLKCKWGENFLPWRIRAKIKGNKGLRPLVQCLAHRCLISSMNHPQTTQVHNDLSIFSWQNIQRPCCRHSCITAIGINSLSAQKDKTLWGGGEELGGRLILTFISLIASCKMLFIIEALIFWNELIQGKTSFKQLQKEQWPQGSLSTSQRFCRYTYHCTPSAPGGSLVLSSKRGNPHTLTFSINIPQHAVCQHCARP